MLKYTDRTSHGEFRGRPHLRIRLGSGLGSAGRLERAPRSQGCSVHSSQMLPGGLLRSSAAECLPGEETE